jgi:hypothetical protein
MEKTRLTPLMLSVPIEIRDRLRKIAARQNLERPDQVTSAAQVARELICQFIDKLEANVPSDPA